MRVANKRNVAGNFGIIMMMITNNYFIQGDGMKEAEERHKLLKMIQINVINWWPKWNRLRTSYCENYNNVKWCWLNQWDYINWECCWIQSKLIVWVNWPKYKVSFRLFHAQGFHESATELLNFNWVVLNKTWHVHSPYFFLRSSRSRSLYRYRRLS